MTLIRTDGAWGRMACAVLWLVLMGAATAAAAFPQQAGLVNDFANVIEPSREAEIDALLHRIAQDGTAHVVVATVPSLDGMTIEEYAAALFREWGVGAKQGENGVLVLVAPGDRSVRIEVGDGAEPVIPDRLAGEIIRTAFEPRFRTGQYGAGILDGISWIAVVMRERSQNLPPRITSTSVDLPSPWIVVPLLGVFVALGALAAGAGVRTEKSALLMVAALFGGLPFVILLVMFPLVSLLTVAPVAAVMGLAGYTKAGTRRWRDALRSTSAHARTEWAFAGPALTTSDASDGIDAPSASPIDTSSPIDTP